MLTTEEMIFRLCVAIVLGAIIGVEREYVGKEAGIRTDIMVAAGAALFSMVSVVLPYIIAPSPSDIPDIIARNSGFLGVIANIVVGVGFLGAGVIIKHEGRVYGLTTAAAVWFVAAIGVLAGVGLVKFACIATAFLMILLVLLRQFDIMRFFGKKQEE